MISLDVASSLFQCLLFYHDTLVEHLTCILEDNGRRNLFSDLWTGSDIPTGRVHVDSIGHTCQPQNDRSIPYLSEAKQRGSKQGFPPPVSITTHTNQVGLLF